MNVTFVDATSKIVETFGKKNIFMTFVPFKGSGKELNNSTFGSDNIRYMHDWSYLMEAKLASGSVRSIALVLRRFLRGDQNMVEKFIPQRNETIKIPKKEMWHFLFVDGRVALLDAAETYECQNTDAQTGEKLEPEAGIIFRSSIELFAELFGNKFDADKILDRINEIGMENITEAEKAFLKNGNVENKA